MFCSEHADISTAAAEERTALTTVLVYPIGLDHLAEHRVSTALKERIPYIRRTKTLPPFASSSSAHQRQR